MKKTSPPKTAVALKYEGQGAPRVSAKGQHKIAEQIIQLAEESGVPIINDPELAAVLAQVELDAEIPPELYEAIAAVLAFVYHLKRPPADSNPPKR